MRMNLNTNLPLHEISENNIDEQYFPKYLKGEFDFTGILLLPIIRRSPAFFFSFTLEKTIQCRPAI